MNKFIIPFVLCIFISAKANKYDDLMTFSSVFNILKTHYVEPVDSKKIIYGAIKGMVRELDPYTDYLTPEMYSEFVTETTGRFGGVGIELTIVEDYPTVISAIEDSPAEKAGIKSGDKIIFIEKTPAKKLSLSEISMLVKGKLGSKIKITIENENGTREVTLKRKIIKSKSVKYHNLGEGFSYYRISTFSKDTSNELISQMKKHKEKEQLKGVIIDLRNNPGGLLEQAVEIADMFLSGGIIVTTKDRNGTAEVMNAKSDRAFEGNFPIIVLIDEHSASASEILASALRDNKRALIMGRRSFGKASVQSLMPLADGGALKITVAKYHTPSDKPIHEVGVKPDIVVTKQALEKSEDDKTKLKKSNTAGVAGTTGVASSILDDNEVKTAFSYLKAHTLMNR